MQLVAQRAVGGARAVRRTIAGSTAWPGARSSSTNRRTVAAGAQDEVKTIDGPSPAQTEAERVTEQYGLEAGLVNVLTSKGEPDAPLSRTEQAKRLLAQYGSAYLLTSISFAIVSFAACYAAVSAGVDVASLLAKVGLTVNDTSEKVGTFAIAYAAHKALSPIRFPPTVALTPIVAKWTGRKTGANDGVEHTSE